jgi:hypothetical protein
MGFTKPIEQLLLSYQGTINVSEIYYTRGTNNAKSIFTKVGVYSRWRASCFDDRVYVYGSHDVANG